MQGAVTHLAEIPVSNRAHLRLQLSCTSENCVETRLLDCSTGVAKPCVLTNFVKKVTAINVQKLKEGLKGFWAQVNATGSEVKIFPRLLGGGCGSSNSTNSTAPGPVPKPPLRMFTLPAASLTLADVQNYKLQPSDYFTQYTPTCTTILNSHIAALKRCIELTQGVAIFEDPDFGPKQQGGATSLYYKGTAPAPGYVPTENVKWVRPSDLIQNTCFFSNELSANDSVQGALGDCWFIGALSVIATRDELIRGSIENLDNPAKVTMNTATGLKEGVYPPIFHPFARKGLYCFSFFKNSKWRYVIIDDKLPFSKDSSEPSFVFAHCREHRELWVPLIEKGYAKLHSCYEALVSGSINDGLVDMTGYACDTLKLQGKGSELEGPPEKKEQMTGAFWEKMKVKLANGSLMGCSIDTGGTEETVMMDQHATGLFSGHAYSITTMLYVDHPQAQKPKKRHRLLVVRNPWGEAQWNGKWGQRSSELTDNLPLIKNIIDTTLNEQERFDPTDTATGEFLICYKDWRSVFTTLFLCEDFPSAWSGIRFKGAWTAETAGGLPIGSPESLKSWGKNPQFIVDLKVPADVFVMLFQDDGRLVPHLPFPFTGFVKNICVSMLRLESGEEGLTEFIPSRLVKNSPVREYRDTNIDTMKLTPGRYLIVPSIKEPGLTATFYMSVYFSCPKPGIRIQQKGTNYAGDIILEEEETSAKANPAQVHELQQLVAQLLRI